MHANPDLSLLTNQLLLLFHAQMFYDGIQDLDPDDDQHIMVCLGGDYTPPHPFNDTGVVSKDNLPYRGIDSSYSNRWCSNAIETMDEQDKFGGFNVTSELCDHYSAEEIAQIPHISTNVKEALKFLSKDDEGFFLMYEQGDVS
jgi:alkaline phosphatase